MAGEPIVEFYIQHYMMNGSIIDQETLFQTVPFSEDPVINNPKVKNEIGKAGSLEFEMEIPSPYYNAMLQLKTIIRVVYFGHTIFRGRVLTIDKKLERTRTVHCEGDFVFLLDTHQLSTKEEARSKITVLAYLQQIISQHNSDLFDAEPDKCFVLGEVPGQYSSGIDSDQQVDVPDEKENQKFGDNSWNTSMDRIEDLVSEFGGYFRTRYDASNAITYLDWFDNFYSSSINTQTIEVTKNLIDLSGPTEVENLFTIVIPIGKNGDKEIYISDYWPIASSGHSKVNYMMVPELATIPLYTDSELNSVFHKKSDYRDAIDRFGYIWKVQTFDNANTSEKLFTYCKDWIKNNFMPEITQWDVTALDMKILDSENQVLLCGDRINLIHPEVDQTYAGLTAISAEYDLYNPDKNKYSIGIPNSRINVPYGVKNNSSKSSSGISNNQNGNTPHEGEDNLDALKAKLEQQYSLKTDWDTDILLDNALSFVMYDTEGNERDQKDVLKDTASVANELLKTKSTKMNELLPEAIRRGVSVDDPQLLIDYTPSVKQQQTDYKADTEWYYVNTVGLTYQQAEVLLNETAGQSWLASLTNGDGTWTDYAYSQGAAIWRNRDEMQQQSINTKKILNGEKTTERGIDIVGLFSDVTGLNLDVGGGFMTTDIDLSSFNLGEDGSLINAQTITDTVTGLKTDATNLLDGFGTFISEEKNKTSGTGTWEEKIFNFGNDILNGNNTESGGKEVEVKSDTVDIDGKTDGGNMGIGSGSLSGWKITLNKPMTYTSGGQTFTVPAGSVASDDFHITNSYDSLKAKLLVVDVMLADYAEIGTLSALKATVDTITSNRVTVDNYVSAAHLNCTNLVASNNVYAGSHIYIEDTDGRDQDVGKCFDSALFTERSDGTIILTLGRANGSASATPSFNMAATQFFIDSVAAAKASIGLTTPIWNNGGVPYGTDGWTPTSRTVSVWTTGKDENIEQTIWLGIEKGSWSSGSIGVGIYKDGWPGSGGTKMAGLTINNSWSAGNISTSSDEPTGHTYYKTYYLDDSWGEFSISVNGESKWFKIGLS